MKNLQSNVDAVWHTRIRQTLKKLTGNAARVTTALVLAAIVAVPSAQALSSGDIELLISLGIIPAEKAAAARAAVELTPPATSCGTFTRDLTLGSTGADVVALQTFLETRGVMTIPAGVSKGYFGPLTRQALAQYQAAAGIAPAVGYFGPLTRANLATVCKPTNPTTPTTPGNQVLSGGEASLESYDALSKYSNEDLEEGETGKVFAAEFSVEDGDIRLERVDVRVEAVNESKEDEPWKQIDELVLYMNGKKVATKDVDSKNDWSRQASTDSSVSNTRSYETRFTGIDAIFEEGDDVEIEIEVVTSNRIDDGDLTQSWKIWIPNNGIRGTDGEGIQQYTGSDSESKKFSIEAADDGDVSIRESDDDLDAAILIVDANNKSSTHEVFRFEIDANDADIFLNTLTIVASTSDDNIGDLLSELTIEIDGDDYHYDTASTTGNIGEYTFDFEDNNDEVGVDEDETVEVVVYARFNKTTGNYADGTSVQFGAGRIDGANYGAVAVTAEGQSTGDDATVSGRQEGAVHTLRTTGVVLKAENTSFTYRSNVSDTLSDDEGVYTFSVKITALEEDVWIDNTVATTSSSTAGFVTTVTGSSFTGTSSARISNTTAKVQTNNRYKISEGSSATFEITVELDPAAEGAFGLDLTSVNFADSSTATPVAYTVPNSTDFRIASKTIKN